MGKHILIILAFFLLLLLHTRPTHACSGASCVEVASARMAAQETPVIAAPDHRIAKLERFLAKKKSPLTPYASFIIETADAYDIPWTMVPAISGIESSFCQRIPHRSFNCWGWENGKTRFTSYEHAIETVTKTLKTRYIDRGRTTPERIARIYAPPSNHWAGKLRYFTRVIQAQTLDSRALPITL